MALGNIAGRIWFALTADNRAFNAAMNRSAKTIDATERRFRSFQKTIRSYSKYAAAAAAAAGAIVGREVLMNTAAFEDQMNRVRAVTGATGKEFDRLSAQARNLGATTRFSASEVASGSAFLGQAGFRSFEILESMPALLNLASAGMLELGKAADIASNIMGAFEINARDASDVADVLAATAAGSNTDILQLGEAMSYVAPIAHSMGLNIRDTAAAIGILGNNGLQASRAGTGLNTIFSRLLRPSEAANAVFERLGITLRDSHGELRNFVDILGELHAAGATTEDFFNIFELRGGPAAAILASQARNAREFRDELDQTEGAVKRMADTMEEGLGGGLRSVRSAWEGLTIAIGKSPLGQNIAKLIDLLAESLRALTPEIVVAADSLATLREGYDKTTTEIESLEKRLEAASRRNRPPLLARIEALTKYRDTYQTLPGLQAKILEIEKELVTASGAAARNLEKQRQKLQGIVDDIVQAQEAAEAAAQATQDAAARGTVTAAVSVSAELAPQALTNERLAAIQRGQLAAMQKQLNAEAIAGIEGRIELEAQVARLLTQQERIEARIHAVAETNRQIAGLRVKLAAALTEEARARIRLEIRQAEAYKRGQAAADISGGTQRQVGLIDVQPRQRELTQYEQATHRIISRMEVLGEAGKRAFDGIGNSIKQAILQTESWGDAAKRVLRILLFSGLEAFLQPTTFGGLFGGQKNRIRKLATGGMLPAGMPAIVGERGPELVVSDRDRYVIPNSALGAGAAGSNITVINNITGSGDPYSTASEVVAMFDRRAKGLIAVEQRRQAYRTRAA